MDNHAKLFHMIAPVYSIFFKVQERNYLQLLGKYMSKLPQVKTALDIGCGSGAFSSALHRQGIIVTGADYAPAMVKFARRLNPAIKYIVADAQKLPFPDKSFDLVTAAFVAHGLTPLERLELYRESARVAGKMVLLHDYNHRRHPLSDFVEMLEGGNYFSFLSRGIGEMKAMFSDVTVLLVGPRTNWYICDP